MAEIFHNDFSGGMIRKKGPMKLADNESPLILNYHLDSVGDLTKRYGYTRLANQPVTGKTVNGMFMFTDVNSTKTCALMVINNAGNTQGVIYYRTSGNWTSSLATDTAGKITRFAAFCNYVFRVNGTDVVATSTDPVAPTWGTTNAPATITPKLIAVYEDRVYVANQPTTGQRSRLFFSSLPTSGTTITWDTTNDQVDINPDDNDEITALENNGNSLMIFKNRSLYRWKFKNVEPDRIIGVGAPTQEAVWTNFDLGITFFANEWGGWAYTGGYPKNVGRKIQPFFDAIAASTLTSIRTTGDHDHWFIYPGANLTVDGRTYTNPVLVYTISLDAWTIYTFAHPVGYFGRYIFSGSEDVYFGGNTGEVFQLGGVTVNSDDSGATTPSAIAGEIEFKEDFLGHDTNWVEDMTIYSKQPIGPNYTVRFNNTDDWKTLGETRKKVTKIGVRDEGNYVQFRASDNSISRSVIEAYAYEYQPLREEKEDD